MNKKYQIFISSTYEDLKEERRKVQDTILSMYHFPIGMEMFSAADEEQWEIIKETIDSSDYYVLIIGHRYGSEIQEGEFAGISYTQKEFRYALEQKIPVLAFIIDNKIPVKPEYIENDTQRNKLIAFINEVLDGRTVQRWTSGEDLANKVMNSLNKQINRRKRPGWVRADVLNFEESQKEMIELNKEIRKLREENAELKKSITRKPDLKIEINDSTTINIPFLEDKTNAIDCEYMNLSMDLVPYEARNSITQSMLDDYNSKLPSKEIIEEYKREMRFYKQAQEKPFNIDIRICNKGNKKANDIYIEMIFPEEIVVHSKEDKIPVPQMPKKGINPIDKFYSDRIFGTDEMTKFTILPRSADLVDAKFISQLNSPNKHFCNDDNSLSIRCENLINSYTWSIEDDYILIPKKKGNYQIECHFMCEEYEKVDTQMIDVIVE